MISAIRGRTVVFARRVPALTVWKAALFIFLAAVAGCQSRGERALKQSGPEVLYKQAHSSLRAYDFNLAIKTYESLIARFPFSDETRQARLDLIYAYYRAGESESAIDAADQFVRENPSHPRVDYTWYMKGLVDFERTPNILERWFRVDLANRPPTTAKKSFAAFKTVVEKYPHSEYAHDARRRMVYLRNRLANYELHVARYYQRRGAHVAVIRRAKTVLEEFDGAPAVKEALELLAESYDRLGLPELAEQSRQVYAANFGARPMLAQADTERSWWKFWR